MATTLKPPLAATEASTGSNNTNNNKTTTFLPLPTTHRAPSLQQAVSGRLFTMIDFVRNDPVVPTKLVDSSTASDEDSSGSGSSSFDSEGSSTGENDNKQQQVVHFNKANNRQPSVLISETSRRQTLASIAFVDLKTVQLQEQLRQQRKQRRKSKRKSTLTNLLSNSSVLPDWHPLAQINEKRKERYYQVKNLATSLPLSTANINSINQSIMSSSYAAILAGAANSASLTGHNTGLSTALEYHAPSNLSNLNSNNNQMLVEIGPGGVPPTSLKTVRRRAMAQLQACENQIVNFKIIWLKNNGKEGGIPNDIEFFCADIEHLMAEAAQSKQMPLSKKPSVAAWGGASAAAIHNQRSSLSKPQNESLASQQSSKPSRAPAHHNPKKFGAEVNEIRRMTSLQQLRTHLQGLYESRNNQLRLLDSRQLIAKSLRIIERCGEYEVLYETLRPNLQAIASMVSRYCSSFIHEVENVQVDCVWEYNNTINTLQKAIDSAFLRMEESRKAIDRKEKTCAALLITENDTDTWRLLSEEGVDQMEGVVRRLKQWIIDDERFEVRLRDTLRFFIQHQKELADELRTEQRKKDQLKRMSLRREFKASLIENDGQSHATEGNRLQRILEALEENESKLNDKFHARSQELRQAESDNQGDQRATPIVSNIETLKRQLSATRKRIRAVKLRMTLLESEIVNMSQAKEANLEIGRRELTDSKKYNKLASETETDLKQLEAKIRTVVRIIDLKRNPDILKRIFFQQQTGAAAASGYGAPYEPADTDQLMTTAITLIAQEIGHHLPELYRRLPFSPTRSAGRRKRDLVQLGCREVSSPPFPNYPSAFASSSSSPSPSAHSSNFPSGSFGGRTSHNNHGGTFVVTGSGAAATSNEAASELRKLAYQVLRKWRRLNKNVTVMQLAEALRSINQTKLADAIESARIKTLGLPAIHSRARVLANSSVF